MKPAAILTDIEGTTSSIAFVHDVLFPYSRARIADYVRAHAAQLVPQLAAVRVHAGDDGLDVEGCIAKLVEWHDADAKIGPLKAIQGMIWEAGYRSGELKGHVYPDAVAGLKRWHGAGIALYIYSSGSVAAQKLLFGHSVAGDLNPLFSGNFDTAVGGKREAASYARIAEAIGAAPGDILFLSDVIAELDAAAEAGMAVTLLVREGEAPQSAYPVATGFETILPEAALA